MTFLKRERETLERFLPSLDEQLAAIPLAEIEKPGNPGLSLLRDLYGAALLIPEEHGGRGVSPVDAIRVHRAVGSRSPSLAIAMTMHNFSVATLVEYCFYGDYTVELLKQISEGQLLVASGFAEGKSGTNILAPLMRAIPRDGGGYRINGSKKPCSLSHSMHILTASVAVPHPSGRGGRRAVAVVPADAKGLSREPFWKSTVLAGAESDELRLTDVDITDEQLFFPEMEESLDTVEAGGFLWFELLLTASYLGVASALVERAVSDRRGDAPSRTLIVAELETAMTALEGIARAMQTGVRGEEILARSLFVRIAAQEAITRASAGAAELLGGMAFVGSPDIPYLLAAGRALAFHPPSRLSVAPALDDYLAGQPLQVA